MAKLGSFQSSEMKKLQEELETLQKNREEFLGSCARELAARLLSKVIKRTPVGVYASGSGKTGGTLRRGWTGSKQQSGTQYAKSLPIRKAGSGYTIEITNPVEYASYVEYGHRTANHSGWVPGQFVMTIAEQEIRQAAPQILERKIQKYLGGVLK